MFVYCTHAYFTSHCVTACSHQLEGHLCFHYDFYHTSVPFFLRSTFYISAEKGKNYMSFGKKTILSNDEIVCCVCSCLLRSKLVNVPNIETHNILIVHLYKETVRGLPGCKIHIVSAQQIVKQNCEHDLVKGKTTSTGDSFIEIFFIFLFNVYYNTSSNNYIHLDWL